jgi:hypothetical protein
VASAQASDGATPTFFVGVAPHTGLTTRPNARGMQLDGLGIPGEERGRPPCVTPARWARCGARGAEHAEVAPIETV